MSRKLFRILISLIMIFFLCESTSLKKNDSFDQVIEKILELNLFQISIFRTEETVFANSTKFKSIIGKISSKIPTFFIDINETKLLNNSQGMENKRKVFNSGLYLIVEDVRNFNVLKFVKNFNMIAESNPQPPRAKCLLVLIGNSKPIETEFQHLFIAAWGMKFLDFSILTLNDHKDLLILNYNPFFKSFGRESISEGQLFPDKLNDMNGLKIKTILYSLPPLIELSKKSNETIINGVNYGFLKLTSEVLNFSFNYVENNVLFKRIFEKLEKGDIDMTIMALAVGTQLAALYKKGLLLLGNVIREANMYLYVPVIYTDTYVSMIDSEIILY